ncbi:MAG: hypothetical protein ACHREM_00650 [Polyangiales bacterium]
MGWATKYIDALARGETVQFRPLGKSMSGLIESGQLCTVEPIRDRRELKLKDIVLCRVKGAEYLHLVTGIESDDRFQISNNRGYVNGWIRGMAIFGRLSRVE